MTNDRISVALVTLVMREMQIKVMRYLFALNAGRNSSLKILTFIGKEAEKHKHFSTLAAT